MLFPLKTLLGKGVSVAGGSDCPMEPLSPLTGIQSAMTRTVYPKERLNFEEALRLYTVNAAYLTLEENEKGSIEEGKLADLAVLSCDPSSVPSGKLGEVEVEMTVIGGRVCYQKRAS
jgi:hypothetical protein